MGILFYKRILLMESSYKKIAIIAMYIFCLTGCSGKDDITSLEPEAAQTPAQEVLTIDYPFDDPEAYALTLEKLPDSPDEYELILHGRYGKVLQQIPCGRLEEPIEFSYDGLAYRTRNNLEIFPSGSTTGLLFVWEEDRFSQEAIEIPKYEEFQDEKRYVVTVHEEGDKLEKRAYLLNEEERQVEEIWNYSLDRESGWLQIWDNLEGINLFDGTVHLDEDKNPQNAEYFDMFLWNDRYIMLDYEEQSLFPAWVGRDEKAEEWGEAKDYESRQVFLEEYGFENSEPMYQYFDQYGNARLELYMDDAKENICGIVHDYILSKSLKKMDFQYGFTFHAMWEQEWEEGDKYSLKSYDGFDGTEHEDYVKDYEANTEYCKDGRPDHFRSTGRIDDYPENSMVLDINFIYREDGTLYCREYDHNGLVFGTLFSHLDSYYDEKERVVYEEGYITHGHLEYYYIYEDKEDQSAIMPSYCLFLDYAQGYAVPSMVRYQ